MARGQGNTSQPPPYHPSIFTRFSQNRTGGPTAQTEASSHVPSVSASAQGIQSRPPVDIRPPSAPSPPPPPPLTGPEPSYGQEQYQLPNPHAQLFLPHNHPQPFFPGHPTQHFQNHHYNQTPPFPYPFPPPVPYHSYQTGVFTGPSQYELLPPTTHTQTWPAMPASNRSDRRGRGRGRGRASFPKHTHHTARPSYHSNSAEPPNPSAASQNTVEQTNGLGPAPSLQDSSPALINTNAAASTPQESNHDSNTHHQKQASSPQFKTPSPCQQVPQASPTEEGSSQSDTERPILHHAASANLSDILEYPDAPTPKRAPTPVQTPIQDSPSATNLAPVSAPPQVSPSRADPAPVQTPIQTPPSAIRAEFSSAPATAPLNVILFTSQPTDTEHSSPLRPPRFAPQTIVKILSDFRKDQAVAFEGMFGAVEKVAYCPLYKCYVYFVRLLALGRDKDGDKENKKDKDMQSKRKEKEHEKENGNDKQVDVDMDIVVAGERQLHAYPAGVVVGDSVCVRGDGDEFDVQSQGDADLDSRSDTATDTATSTAPAPAHIPFASWTQSSFQHILRTKREENTGRPWSEGRWEVRALKPVVRMCYLTYRCECECACEAREGNTGIGVRSRRWFELCDVRAVGPGGRRDEDGDVEVLEGGGACGAGA